MSSSSRSNQAFAEFPHVKMMGKTLKWKAKSGMEVAPSCPRCFSSNTKFCYYNNYSVSQPRYFCKACRRYWTKGGSLRNVPIGGGCRKTRRAATARRRSSSPPPPAAAPPKNVVKDNYDESCFNFAAAATAAVFECGGGVIGGGEGGGDGQLGNVHGCFVDGGEDLVYENFGGFGSEMFPNLEGFGLQAPLMQELGVFGSGGEDEDRMRMSYENFVTDNWASFDLSAYDNF